MIVYSDEWWRRPRTRCWSPECRVWLPELAPWSPRGSEHYCDDCVRTRGRTSHVDPEFLADQAARSPLRSIAIRPWSATTEDA